MLAVLYLSHKYHCVPFLAFLFFLALICLGEHFSLLSSVRLF